VRKLSTLHYTLLISIGLHAALLTLRIVAPERFDRILEDSPLEVVLVNARGKEPPVKAQALAQANLQGGGEAAAGRATSPLPPSATAEIGEATEEQHAQLTELQNTQRQLLAQVKHELAILPAPDPRKEARSEQARQQAERRRQLIQLLAQIEKRINEENVRPRRHYVSPATREVVYAKYYDRMRRRIEERGTRDFPTYQGRKLYGELTLNISVDQTGHVVQVDVVQGSGNELLDHRAVALVQACAPFGDFTAAMRRSAEVLVITSRFRYTREDGLETTVSNSAHHDQP